MAFFNPFRPAYLEDPYPVLARLRNDEPVHWSPDVDAWIVTRYADCLHILQDDETFTSDPTAVESAFAAEVREKRRHVPLGGAVLMGNSDPPDHTRLRAIVNRGFTPRVIEAMAPPIERSAAALLEELEPLEACNVIARFAEPLAVSNILQHLGIPREDFGRFRAWSLALMRARAEGASAPGVVDAATRAQTEMFEFLAAVAAEREASDAETPVDVLSVLIAASDDESIRPEEMMMMLIHISLAGNGPTSMAIGNAIAALGNHPEAQAALRENPALIPAAIEELFRFDSSTHFVARWARTDVVLGKRTLRAGQQVHVMVGAANRDPERFSNPDSLEIERSDNRHLSFGFGIHFCLGAPLARLELRIALERFLGHVGPYEVIAAQRVPNYQLHGFQHLQIRQAT